MRTRTNLLLTGGLALAGLAAVIVMAGSSDATGLLTPDDTDVVALGQSLYAEHCAACHGAQLEGAPNWQIRDADGLLPAPPHDATGHTWHHTDDVLFNLTKFGLANYLNQSDYKSNMPAYNGVLTDHEIKAILSFIKSSWSPKMREHQDYLNSQ